jgi:hypothetical protein
MSLLVDPLNDGVINAQMWEPLIFMDATVQETTQLECTVNAEIAKAGLRSLASYDFTNKRIDVDCDLGPVEQCVLGISITKSTMDIWSEPDFYLLSKYANTMNIEVHKKIAGQWSRPLQVPWAGGIGSLGIASENGTMVFYENGAEVYREASTLPFGNVYIWFFGDAGWSIMTGVSSFTNFVSNIPLTNGLQIPKLYQAMGMAGISGVLTWAFTKDKIWSVIAAIARFQILF